MDNLIEAPKEAITEALKAKGLKYITYKKKDSDDDFKYNIELDRKLIGMSTYIYDGAVVELSLYTTDLHRDSLDAEDEDCHEVVTFESPTSFEELANRVQKFLKAKHKA